jgi:hypothetical protein
MNRREYIRIIQELRRSNAAVPVRNRRKYTRKIKHRGRRHDEER